MLTSGWIRAPTNTTLHKPIARHDQLFPMQSAENRRLVLMAILSTSICLLDFLIFQQELQLSPCFCPLCRAEVGSGSSTSVMASGPTISSWRTLRVIRPLILRQPELTELKTGPTAITTL